MDDFSCTFLAEELPTGFLEQMRRVLLNIETMSGTELEPLFELMPFQEHYNKVMFTYSSCKTKSKTDRVSGFGLGGGRMLPGDKICVLLGYRLR
jgi:hypothetical protein